MNGIVYCMNFTDYGNTILSICSHNNRIFLKISFDLYRRHSFYNNLELLQFDTSNAKINPVKFKCQVTPSYISLYTMVYYNVRTDRHMYICIGYKFSQVTMSSWSFLDVYISIYSKQSKIMFLIKYQGKERSSIF